ncbi:MAG: helix-turn-helix domain-containing protein [Exilibacterium sp.]
MNTASKQKRAFYRKLYLSYLIDTEKHSVPSLQQKTGMPRRTIQDCLKTLSDINIRCEFVPIAGARNNAGFYRIVSWGPIQQDWVRENIDRIVGTLKTETLGQEVISPPGSSALPRH